VSTNIKSVENSVHKPRTKNHSQIKQLLQPIILPRANKDDSKRSETVLEEAEVNRLYNFLDQRKPK
jgi:hypothetical protein